MREERKEPGQIAKKKAQTEEEEQGFFKILSPDRPEERLTSQGTILNHSYPPASYMSHDCVHEYIHMHCIHFEKEKKGDFLFCL